MKDGYIKAAAASPPLRVADCAYNVQSILAAIERADKSGVVLLVLPELCVTAYTCEDLFLQRTLLDAAERAVFELADATKGKNMLVVAGAPLEKSGRLYNCAVVLNNGELLGIVPKSYPPSYSEFYEQRYFAPAPAEVGRIRLGARDYPFGSGLLFACQELRDFIVGVEICEDLFATVSPGAYLSLAGATIIANPSASDELVGKPEYRRKLVSVQSRKNIGGYVYCNAPRSESTNDVVYSAHNILAEYGTILAESAPFEEGYAETEMDVQLIANERRRMTSVRGGKSTGSSEMVYFSLDIRETVLTRPVRQLSFVPGDAADLAGRCRDILNIQSEGLRRRMEHTSADKAIIGVSGGLDSTLALLVTLRSMHRMGRPSSDIVGITMPCFGTTKRTRGNAEKLCTILGADFREIDITASVRQHLSDIGHDGVQADITFENAQARERTQVLMDIANKVNGLVIGTGDLSELALGWCTYNGDHMSMYGVNASVPKTLVRHLVKFSADEAGGELKEVLYDILDTPVSPELLPTKDGELVQKTEDSIGPYELHDFFLYYMIRWGFTPHKIRRLARIAFAQCYTEPEINRWLSVFVRRFFSQQFKRSCLPNGPKVGSVALSPRGDWRMPSDADSALWLKQLSD